MSELGLPVFFHSLNSEHDNSESILTFCDASVATHYSCGLRPWLLHVVALACTQPVHPAACSLYTAQAPLTCAPSCPAFAQPLPSPGPTTYVQCMYYGWQGWLFLGLLLSNTVLVSWKLCSVSHSSSLPSSDFSFVLSSVSQKKGKRVPWAELWCYQIWI